ncbi:hypothetical protein C823_007760 [Eubacterium plexicaudatum ASF492]|uniref:Uncharacterized protein n=1 Tax=Eubacterium plexicaudatum ASF492 TaxID=1235802 RepID=N1ZVQ5_9FIRM|nr:hypothetical protein C823_007760 [Eubacterium plexicaudatum ASF492]
MKNELSSVLNNGILSNPGDELYARITPTGRKVIKVKKNGKKASATQYKSGKTVYTFSS